MADLQLEIQTELLAHLLQLTDQPALPLDKELFASCQLLELSSFPEESSREIVTLLLELLPKLQEDPTPATKLLLKLIEPYPFSEILRINHKLDLSAGLDLNADAFHLPTIALLRKATNDPNDAAILANMPNVILALVRLWLGTSKIDVAEKADEILFGLLWVDRRIPKTLNDAIRMQSFYPGYIWRRIFGDRDVYGAIYMICDHNSQDPVVNLSRQDKNRAQARLMKLVPKIGLLHWNCLILSHNIEVETRHGLKPGEEGLLHFVAFYMVDYQNDVLMHMLLIKLFSELLKFIRVPPCDGDTSSSASLEFIISNGIHRRTSAHYLDQSGYLFNNLDKQLLYQAAADYLGTYASYYSKHFLSRPDRAHVVDALYGAFERGFHSQLHDLNLLTSIPRVALMPGAYGIRRTRSPLALMLDAHLDATTTFALATIIRGPRRPDLEKKPDQFLVREPEVDVATESAAARTLFMFFHCSRFFWASILHKANTLAIVDDALSAVSLMKALITANWSQYLGAEQSASNEHPGNDSTGGSEPSATSSVLITDDKLIRFLPDRDKPLPVTPVNALFEIPDVIKWLINPFTAFDPAMHEGDSPEFRVGMAKYKAVKALSSLLSQLEEPNDKEKAVLAAANRYVAKGPFASRQTRMAMRAR